jgi:hypothetical protein
MEKKKHILSAKLHTHTYIVVSHTLLYLARIHVPTY